MCLRWVNLESTAVALALRAQDGRIDFERRRVVARNDFETIRIGGQLLRREAIEDMMSEIDQLKDEINTNEEIRLETIFG